MFLHTMSHNVISDYKPTKNAAIQKHRILKRNIPDLKYIEKSSRTDFETDRLTTFNTKRTRLNSVT